MSFEINKNLNEEIIKLAKEKVKDHFEKEGFTVVQSEKDDKNSLGQLIFKNIKQFDEEYIKKVGIDKVDWEVVKKQTDLPEWFTEKYKEYLK